MTGIPRLKRHALNGMWSSFCSVMIPSRRLPDDWIAGWDDWLQRELVRSRAELGDDAWLPLYLVAPVRRFWLAPGLLSVGWLGLLSSRPPRSNHPAA